MISFEIKWGSKRFPIELTEEEYENTTVLDLKLKCKELTEIETSYMKLLAYGAQLKNDDELISKYKIKSGSKLMLMGTKIRKQDSPVAIKLQRIRNMRESVLRPDIKRYQKQAEEYLANNKASDTKQTKELINYGNYIHEQLMHQMQQLDTMPEVTDEERIERKNNVKETESLLDLIESIKHKLK